MAESEETDPDPASAFPAAGRLFTPCHGGVIGGGRCRVRHSNATANRFPSYANREQRGALAGEAIAADLRRDAAPSQAEIRLPGSDRVRATAFLQCVAHDRRPPAS